MGKLELKKDILYQQLKDDIYNGVYREGEKLPNEKDFARQLGVGKVTLRSALERLEEESLIVRGRAKGTIVSHSINRKRILVLHPQDSGIESSYHRILPGIEEKAKELNIELERCHKVFHEQLSNESLKEFIEAGQFTGIILIANGFLGHEKSLLVAKESGLPTVLPHGNHQDYITTGFAAIYSDEKKAFQDALSHLKEHGHQRVATIFGKSQIENYAREFYRDEYIELLQKIGLKPVDEYIAYCGYERDEIRAAIEGFLRLGAPPSAILCNSDFYALHVYEILKELNISIPRQMAVMGYANYDGGRFLSPPLTTVDLGIREAGSLAVDLLNRAEQWWGEEQSPPYIVMPHKILARGSTKTTRMEVCIENI